jgi:hypothetical protein
MLDPWIIEEIFRREREGEERRNGERVEIPAESPRYRESESTPPVADESESERGVVIIDI